MNTDKQATPATNAAMPSFSKEHGKMLRAFAGRFTSGNSVPVERTHITRAEWDAICAFVQEQDAIIDSWKAREEERSESEQRETLDAAQPAQDSDEFTPPPEGFTCFHCGSHFASTPKGINAAREHFGETPNAPANCVVVPRNLPFEVLGEAAQAGIFETGNPKHGWDYLLAKIGRPVAQPAQAGEAVAPFDYIYEWDCGGHVHRSLDHAPYNGRRCDRVHAVYLHPQPEQPASGMLPDALVPVRDEWYTLCERRFAVDSIRISGKLAEAIVAAVCSIPEPAQSPAVSHPRPEQPARAEQDALRELVTAGNALSFAAQLTGGVAGRDEALVAAIDAWTKARDAAAVSPAVSPPSVVAVSDEDVEIACNTAQAVIQDKTSDPPWEEWPEEGKEVGRKAIRAALESFAQRIAGSGERDAWLPIESAPKIGPLGPLILRRGAPFIGYWDSRDGVWKDCGGYLRDPTHWLPIEAIAQQNKRGGA